MRIGLDVMGGDNAPDAILDGAIGSLDSIGSDDEIVLVGDAGVIETYLAKHGANDPRLTIVATTEVIAMAEPPMPFSRIAQRKSACAATRMLS